MTTTREAAKITQAELGRRLGKTQSYVSKVEAGERRLDLVEYVYWAKSIGLDPGPPFIALAEAIGAPHPGRSRKRTSKG